MNPNLEKNLTTLIRLAVAAITLLIIYLALDYIFPVVGRAISVLPVFFLPFILALILAILVDPVVTIVEKRLRLSRGLATFISLVLVWGSIALILSLIGSRLVGELSGIYRSLTELSQGVNLSGLIDKIERLYAGLNLPPQFPAQQAVQDNIGVFLKVLQTLVETSIDFIFSFLAALPGVFTIFLIATVATYFMSRDKGIIIDSVLGFVPTGLRHRVKSVTTDLGSALVGFLRAELILISITGFQTVIGLTILQVPYAVTLGILVGLFDILPILGPGTVFVPWIAWQFYLGNFNFSIGLLILYGIVTVVRQFLEPKILSESIGLHPLATLVSLYVGLQALGAIGIIVGPTILVLYQAMKKARLLPSWLLNQDR